MAHGVLRRCSPELRAEPEGRTDARLHSPPAKALSKRSKSWRRPSPSPAAGCSTPGTSCTANPPRCTGSGVHERLFRHHSHAGGSVRRNIRRGGASRVAADGQLAALDAARAEHPSGSPRARAQGARGHRALQRAHRAVNEPTGLLGARRHCGVRGVRVRVVHGRGAPRQAPERARGAAGRGPWPRTSSARWRSCSRTTRAGACR